MRTAPRPAARTGLPRATLLPSVVPVPGAGIPAYGLGMRPMGGPVGRVLVTLADAYDEAWLADAGRLDPAGAPIRLGDAALSLIPAADEEGDQVSA